MASAPHSADAAVASLAVWLAAHPAATVVIDGHADARGSEDGNLHLSRQRALLLSAALERVGIARARITTRGFGSFWPVDEAPADASWNRRAVIHTRGPACPREAEEVIEP
jgi:outer membrane protein OmpA-like peptidoglycan-associated protein